ncbi:MAG: hypothetical protein ACE5FN_07375 [Leptospirillia bacterium]
MILTEHDENRLVIQHGSPWLLGMFALGTTIMLFLLVRTVMVWGWTNEVAYYSIVFLGVSMFGLLSNRLTRFTFDRASGRIHWRRRGVVPASGELVFDDVEQATLDTRQDRRGTGFHRVVLLLSRQPGSGLPIINGRTRDLFRCIDVAEAINAILGKESIPAHMDKDAHGAAERLLTGRYHIDKKRAEGYLAHLSTPTESETGPACGLNP